MKNVKKNLGLGLVTLLILQIVTGLYLVYSTPIIELDQEIIDLHEDLYALIESADIPQGLKEGLLSKVDASLQACIKGNFIASVNMLNALLNQLEAITMIG